MGCVLEDVKARLSEGPFPDVGLGMLVTQRPDWVMGVVPAHDTIYVTLDLSAAILAV